MYLTFFPHVSTQPTNALLNSQYSNLVCTVYLDFVTNTMEYCRGFVQMKFYHSNTRRFAQFQRNLHNFPGIQKRKIENESIYRRSGSVKILTSLSIPRHNSRAPARYIERLDISAHINVLLFTFTWFIDITAKNNQIIYYARKSCVMCNVQ